MVVDLDYRIFDSDRSPDRYTDLQDYKIQDCSYYRSVVDLNLLSCCRVLDSNWHLCQNKISRVEEKKKDRCGRCDSMVFIYFVECGMSSMDYFD